MREYGSEGERVKSRESRKSRGGKRARKREIERENLYQGREGAVIHQIVSRTLR